MFIYIYINIIQIPSNRHHHTTNKSSHDYCFKHNMYYSISSHTCTIHHSSSNEIMIQKIRYFQVLIIFCAPATSALMVSKFHYSASSEASQRKNTLGPPLSRLAPLSEPFYFLKNNQHPL